MYSAVLNATASPLLRLPPEVRCRIYDHLFSSIAIHIRSTEDWDGRLGRYYELYLCETPSDHKETTVRYVECCRTFYQHTFPGCTIDQSDDTPVKPRNIGLGLLGTCRQLYSEAALKPFSRISFATQARLYDSYSGIQRFVDALIPIQARALAHLRITIQNGPASPLDPNQDMLIGPVPSKTLVAKLKGLTDLEIVLVPIIEEEPKVDASWFISGLEKAFILTSGMQSLVKLRLRSLRVTMEAVLHEPWPMLGERAERDAMEAWLRETEMRLQFGSVLLDDEPLPNFGVVQDEKRITLPHWATPEGIERTRVGNEKVNQGSEMRQKALREGRGMDYFTLLDDVLSINKA